MNEEIITRGNDDKFSVDEFFTDIIQEFNQPSVKDIVVITVNHIVPTLLPYRTALMQCMHIAAIIPKGSFPDKDVFPKVQQEYCKISREELAKEGTITKFIKEKIGPQRQFAIIDIGAYFAPCLKE